MNGSAAGDVTRSPDQINPARDHCATKLEKIYYIVRIGNDETIILTYLL